jgi:hypothetical protein
MITVEKAREISIQLNTFFEKIDLNRKNRNAMFRTMDKRYDIFYKDVAKKYLDFMVNKIVSDIRKRIIKASASSIVTKYVDWEKIEEEGVAIYKPAYVSVMAESGGKAYEQARIEGSFDVFNPLSLSWAAKNSLERVTELTNETKDALREVIAQSMRDKMSRVEIGRQIRELPLGLNLTQTKSYYTYRDSLITDGVSDKVLSSKMQSYYNELYRGRCDSIAKTEVSRSVNEGYLQALDQQDVFTTVTISSAADCCEECAAREGEEYTIEEAHGILPLHPRCRCAWVVVYEAKGKPAPEAEEKLAAFDISRANFDELTKESNINNLLFDPISYREGPATTKARIVTDLTEELKDNKDYVEYVKSIWKHPPELAETYLKSDIENVTSSLIKDWAGTSGDESPQAIAMQMAAKEEFGLANITFEHFDPDIIKAAKTQLAKNGEAFKSFLRAQYDATQEYFKENGITSITGYRGMRFSFVDTPSNFEFGKKVSMVEDVLQLQPMSSFSTSPSTAVTFAAERPSRMVVQSKIPVERILSTCQTGYGCKSEAEFVVLGGEETFKIATYGETVSVGGGAPLMRLFSKMPKI